MSFVPEHLLPSQISSVVGILLETRSRPTSETLLSVAEVFLLILTFQNSYLGSVYPSCLRII